MQTLTALPSRACRGLLLGVIAVASTVWVAATSSRADVVSMQLSGGFTSASTNVQSLVATGLLPVRFAYVTGGTSQTGPSGTQFFATASVPQYISIDLGFTIVEFLAGPPAATGSGSVLMRRDTLTDRMALSVNNAVTQASISLVFLDTRRFLNSGLTLPAPFPNGSAFSPDAGNNGWGGPAPSFGFEVFFQHNGQTSWVRGDLFPSTLATAPVPLGVPAPCAAVLLVAAGTLAARRRR